MIAGVALVLFYSSAAIERFLALSVGYLYLVYIVFVVWSLVSFGGRIEAACGAEPIGHRWFMAGVTYAGYNVATIPAVLFCVRHLTRRREAVVARAAGRSARHAAGPGVLRRDDRLPPARSAAAALPSAFLLAKLQAPWFEWAFQIAVLLTLVDTGVPILHAINERVAKAYEERQRLMPRSLRPALAVGIMVLSVYAASAVGLVGLIATGYGLLTYAFIALLVVPVLTVGVWRIRRLPVTPSPRA